MNFISVGEQMKKSLKVVREILSEEPDQILGCTHPSDNHEFVGAGEHSGNRDYWFCSLCGEEIAEDPNI